MTYLLLTYRQGSRKTLTTKLTRFEDQPKDSDLDEDGVPSETEVCYLAPPAITN